MKTPVIVSDDYTVYVEPVQSYIFIHMDVHRWSKTIKNKFMKEWTAWVTKQDQPLYAMPFIDDEKMVKWSKICGFKLLENHLCTDGIMRKLYVFDRTAEWSK